MVRLTKIYTRNGDKGQTQLVGGRDIPKDALRIESYGTVDELNAALGIVRAHLPTNPGLTDTDRDRLMGWLHDVQQRLFDLGAELATLESDRYEGQPTISADHIASLEGLIDEMNQDLKPLTSFVLPGGGQLTAHLHLARTICRRAERRVVTLSNTEAIGEHAIPYLNRLSDALFVVSRFAATRGEEPEILWDY
jgi:cob(I)alamin adenosyltransferase